MLKSIRNEFQLKYFKFVECSRINFSTLQWNSNHHLVFAYRLFMTLYCVAWFIYDVATTVDPYYYAYLTHWGELEMTLYFGIALVVFLKQSKDQAKADNKTRSRVYTITHAEDYTNNIKLIWYHKITYAMLNIYLTLAPSITIVYWIGSFQGLVQPNKSLESINIHVHAINSVLSFIELVMTSIPIRILHFIQPMIFGLTYIIFTLILHWTGVNSGIYDVIDWNMTPRLAAAYGFGLVFGLTTAIHCILVYGVHRFKLYISALADFPKSNKNANVQSVSYRTESFNV